MKRDLAALLLKLESNEVGFAASWIPSRETPPLTYVPITAH